VAHPTTRQFVHERAHQDVRIDGGGQDLFMADALVLLHGFSGTHRAWDAVIAELARGERYRPLALDLPGHGSAGGVRPITFESCSEHVLARAPARFALAGYSMGGRLALWIALARPERVSSLALISTTAGIENGAHRAHRRDADEQQARALEQAPFAEWIARWRAQPVFAGDPESVSRAAAEDQMRNDPSALAAALRGVGTGRMKPMWSRLGELQLPVTVIAGERDAEFSRLARRLAAAIAGAKLWRLPGGHALLLESPGEVAGALRGT
jgi:2-succinyl-6-hydroxy-2,4-cyclohexadiene-1-carboxylate synthase